jgi:hypothetical protein
MNHMTRCYSVGNFVTIPRQSRCAFATFPFPSIFLMVMNLFFIVEERPGSFLGALSFHVEQTRLFLEFAAHLL